MPKHLLEEWSMRLPGAVLILLLATPGAIAQKQTPLERAQAALRAGRPEAALGMYEEILAATPQDAAAQVGAAKCLLALGRVTEAIERLEAEERRSPERADVMLALGEAYFAAARQRLDAQPPGPAAEIKFRLIDAADRLERALRLDPRCQEASYTLGLARLFLDPPEAEAAVKALEAARPLKRTDPAYHFFLGLARQHAASHAGAAEAYRRSAELYQASEATRGYAITAWRRAGTCAAEAGRDKQAADAFTCAFNLDPRCAATFQDVWQVYAGTPEHMVRGLELLQKWHDLAPKEALPLYYLGYLREARGERGPAREAFENVLGTEHGRKFAPAWVKVGEYLYRDDGREEAAEAHAVRALELDPTSADAVGLLQTMVSGHVADRTLARAEALTRTILRFRPEDGREWSNLGLFLRDQGRYRESHLAYRTAVRLAPDHAQVLNDAAVVLHYHLRRPREAEELYRRAVELDPATVDALENLGVLAFDRNDLDQAEAWFRKVLHLEPQRRKARTYLARIEALRKASTPG
jgi:tetratricopeptide (TPR) repeat protein